MENTSSLHDTAQEPRPPDPFASVEMTADQLAEAKRYGRQKLVCELLGRFLSIILFGVMAFVLARPVDAWLAGWVPVDSLRLVALFLIMIGLDEFLSFPVTFYSGHVLEHRYGLSNQSLGRWFLRHAKQFALGAVLSLVMFLGLFWIIWLTGRYWWLVGAGAFFIVTVVLGQLAPVLILPLFYKIERLANEELAERLARLAEGTGLSIEGIYRMKLSDETVKANALLAGLGRTRRVILGDTLLDRFTADEIEVIFAHEIGHHVFGHIPKTIAAGIVYSAAGFWLCDRFLTSYLGVEQFRHAALPVYALPMLVWVLVVFSTLLEPLRNFISRHYERQCDQYALRRTGMNHAYASAFLKLAKLNKDDPNPNVVEVFLFHSHPPISERLALAQVHKAA